MTAAAAAGPAFGQESRGRPAYIYDNAGIITSEQEGAIDSYLRGLDRATTAEIVIYTISSFQGHGIRKDNIEIQDRDMLANYIFNEVTLDGLKGIGKKGKDNGVLILVSLERDAGGGSMRIEVGRGLEGDITDGTAGEILDRFLVPAREQYEEAGSMAAFDQAFFDTVVVLGSEIGYTAEGVPVPAVDDNSIDDAMATEDMIAMALFAAFFIGVIVISLKYGRGRRGARRYGGFWVGGGGGGFGGRGGGGFGGGGGSSGGGGAGR